MEEALSIRGMLQISDVPKIPIPAATRIDHIYHINDFMQVKTYTLAEYGASDYFLVVADFVFPRQCNSWLL